MGESTAEGHQADKPQAPHLKMPVASCLSPFLLARARPALSLGPSRGSSLSWRCAAGWERPALSQQPSVFSSSPSNRANTFLFCRLCQHTSNLLAAGTSPVLVLEPASHLSYFSSIWTRNMPTKISLGFFLGCHSRDCASRPPGLQCHHCLLAASPSTPLTGQHGSQSPRDSPNL